MMVRRDGVEQCVQAGTLLFVQVDHLSGELLGDALEQLYAAGAANVQIVSTVTKKGRPSNLLVIDPLPDKMETVEQVIVTELGATGWHRIATQHVRLRTEIIVRHLSIVTPTGAFAHEVRGKRLTKGGNSVRPEYSSCLALRDRLRTEFDLQMPLSEIVRLIGAALENQDTTVIDLRNAAM